MSLQTLMHPEVWREKITEKYMSTAKLLGTMPIEKKLTKEINYFVQKTLAITPERFAWGGPIPFSMGTYEKLDAPMELYGYGVEIPKIDVDLLPFGWNTIRREVDQKAKGMGLYLDERISEEMIDNAGTEVDASAADWATSADNIQPDVSEAIAELEDLEVDFETLRMIMSPQAHRYMLDALTTTAMTTSPPGRVAGGRVIEYLGVPVEVSTNLHYDVAAGDTVIIYSPNEYGWLGEAYPLTVNGPVYVGEKPGDPKVYRAEMWAMNVPVVDQPDAIAIITEVI